MKTLFVNCPDPNYQLIDTKKWISIFAVLILMGLTINHAAWARGGHGHGSFIGGGGGGHFGGGGGGGHFGGGYRHYGHSHSHYNLGLGFSGFYGPGFYGPGFYGPGFYGYGYPYPYGYRYPGSYYYPRSYYSSPLIAPSAPTVYIQRETPIAASTQPAQTNYWHYCRNPEGYYPYVKECPEGWLQVAPQPAPQ